MNANARSDQLILACYDSKNTAMKKHSIQPLSGRDSPTVGPKSVKESIEMAKQKRKQKIQRDSAPKQVIEHNQSVSINGNYNLKINNPLKESIGFNSVKPSLSDEESIIKTNNITSSLSKVC